MDMSIHPWISYTSSARTATQRPHERSAVYAHTVTRSHRRSNDTTDVKLCARESRSIKLIDIYQCVHNIDRVSDYELNCIFFKQFHSMPNGTLKYCCMLFKSLKLMTLYWISSYCTVYAISLGFGFVCYVYSDPVSNHKSCRFELYNSI